MTSDRADVSERLRPVFRRVVGSWEDAAVEVDAADVLTIRRRSLPAGTEEVAFVVVGLNRLNPQLFEASAAHHIETLLDEGRTIKLLDLEMRSSSEGSPGEIVARVLGATPRLAYIVIFAHSRRAINLSDSGDDLVVEPAAGRSPESVVIRELKLSPAAAATGRVDLYGCHCRPKARWASELASALHWPVRTVYPGYSIYFPSGAAYPRSAIPHTRRLRPSGYARGGWALWMPGASIPVRVSEPGEASHPVEIRHPHLERLLIATVSVGLEPVRDLRKKRHLVAREREQADPARRGRWDLGLRRRALLRR